jgi:predicted acylesterase/phospholipase RssA
MNVEEAIRLPGKASQTRQLPPAPHSSGWRWTYRPQQWDERSIIRVIKNRSHTVGVGRSGQHRWTPFHADNARLADHALTERRKSPVRIALVLSGGGLRGASHVGVLQRLVAHEIPIDIIVGSSAGAIIAAYYAAVGLTLDELIADAERFRGRHLIAHSLNVRLDRRMGRVLTKLSGLIPTRLEQLEHATFERLHHNIRGIGIVCHDVATGRPCYFSTGDDRGVRLSDVVRASASIPYLLPPVGVECADNSLLLTDGGVSDGLPIAFAQRPPLSATHLIVSDCRWLPRRPPQTARAIVSVRPRLAATGTLWSPSSTLLTAVRQGSRAVTNEMLDTIRSWSDPTVPP